MVEFRLLGALEMRAGSQPLDTGQPQQRTVLAALLTDAGYVISTSTLIDRVWGDGAPKTARRSLHSHIARVRRTLKDAATVGGEKATLDYRSGGYLLDVDGDLVDLHLFRRLVSASREPTCAADRRAALLRRAVALWRGEPLAGLHGEWVDRMRESWISERLHAVAAWARAETLIGNPGPAIGPLTTLAAEHPLVESLGAALMRVLCAAGRPSDALDQYVRIRQRLAAELGTDPGDELQLLHRAILRGDNLDRPHPGAADRPIAIRRTVPTQRLALEGGVCDHSNVFHVVVEGDGLRISLTGEVYEVASPARDSRGCDEAQPGVGGHAICT